MADSSSRIREACPASHDRFDSEEWATHVTDWQKADKA
jgi:hypothetical protein